MPTPKIIAFDWDNTVFPNHMHNMLARAGIAPGPQALEQQKSYLRSYFRSLPYSEKITWQNHMTQMATAMNSIMDNGCKIGIASFSAYPEAIKWLLEDPTIGIGLSHEQANRITVKTGDEKNGKVVLLAQIATENKLQPSEKGQILLIDDNSTNVKNAIGANMQAINATKITEPRELKHKINDPNYTANIANNVVGQLLRSRKHQQLPTEMHVQKELEKILSSRPPGSYIEHGTSISYVNVKEKVITLSDVAIGGPDNLNKIKSSLTTLYDETLSKLLNNMKTQPPGTNARYKHQTDPYKEHIVYKGGDNKVYKQEITNGKVIYKDKKGQSQQVPVDQFIAYLEQQKKQSQQQTPPANKPSEMNTLKLAEQRTHANRSQIQRDPTTQQGHPGTAANHSKNLDSPIGEKELFEITRRLSDKYTEIGAIKEKNQTIYLTVEPTAKHDHVKLQKLTAASLRKEARKVDEHRFIQAFKTLDHSFITGIVKDAPEMSAAIFKLLETLKQLPHSNNNETEKKNSRLCHYVCR